MFKVLILQASHSLSDERTEFLIKDRLSFMRFGLGLADPVPDANTIWTFREALTRATLGGRPAIEVLFGAYEAALTQFYLAIYPTPYLLRPAACFAPAVPMPFLPAPSASHLWNVPRANFGA